MESLNFWETASDKKDLVAKVDNEVTFWVSCDKENLNNIHRFAESWKKIHDRSRREESTPGNIQSWCRNEFVKKNIVSINSREGRICRAISGSFGFQALEKFLELVCGSRQPNLDFVATSALVFLQKPDLDAKEGQSIDSLLKRLAARATELDTDRAAAIQSLEERTSTLSNLIDEKIVKLQELEGKYAVYRQLEEPINYWKRVAENSRNESRNYATAAILCGLASFIIVWLCLAKVIAPSIVAMTDPTVGRLLAISGPFTLLIIGCIWLERVLVRLFMSSVNTRLDAEERITLIHTFLALRVHESAVTKEDHPIILSQIFRHAAKGIVRDDATPFFQEWLAKKLAE